MPEPILNKHVMPPGGFYFVDGEGVRFDAENPLKLANKINQYRLQNNKPLGNPIKEINDFTCARYPTGCRGAERKLADAQPTQPLVARVNRWLAITTRALGITPGKYVLRSEAERRAAICAACPQQAVWMACAGCADASRRLSFAARKGQELPGSEKLLGCAVLGEDTRTSIWLDGLKPADRAGLPENCWRKS